MTADVLGLVGSTIEQVRFDACVDAGGFGLIYRGRHLGLDEEVAIKCLRLGMKSRVNEEIREALAGRFRDETKLLYRLSQGSLDIVRCISSGTVVAPTTGELTPYMVLEWLDGQTLSAELRRRREAKRGGRTLDEAVELLDSAVRGLAHAHAQGIVHRDVKPGNLFLTRTRDGVRIKVLDFGLAKILSDEALGIRPSVETAAGTHFCSPSYGAPEQFSPRMGPIGPWTDIYSLALVLLEVLVGEKVRPASSLADGLLKAIEPETGSPTPASLGLALAPSVEALLIRAVAQNPRERPKDAEEFWAALRDAMREAAPEGKTNAEARLAQDHVATLADGDLVTARKRAQEMADAFEAKERAKASQGAEIRLGKNVLGSDETTGAVAIEGGPLSSTLAMVDRPPVPSNPPPPASRKLQITMPMGTTSPLASSIALEQSPFAGAPAIIPPSTPSTAASTGARTGSPGLAERLAAMNTAQAPVRPPSVPPSGGPAGTKTPSSPPPSGSPPSSTSGPRSAPISGDAMISPFATTRADVGEASTRNVRVEPLPPSSSRTNALDTPAPAGAPANAASKVFLVVLLVVAAIAFWFFAIRR